MHAHLIDYPSQTVATFKPSADAIEITVHGERPLWSEIWVGMQEWRKNGKPSREWCTLSIDQQGRQVMQIECQGYDRTVLLNESTEICR